MGIATENHQPRVLTIREWIECYSILKEKIAKYGLDESYIKTLDLVSDLMDKIEDALQIDIHTNLNNFRLDNSFRSISLTDRMWLEVRITLSPIDGDEE
jgi:hypothetical protein